MPRRLYPFLNNSIYHVFNKSIDDRAVFSNHKFSELFLNLLFYYRSQKANKSYSLFRKLDKKLQNETLKNLSYSSYFKIDLLGYCIMPNHFHLLLKQKKENGLVKYLADLINSFTRYVNTTIQRKGPIFLPRFQSVPVVSREQLIHVSRYIHLNPFTAGLVDTFMNLKTYPWSSYREYLVEANNTLCETQTVLSEFDYDKLMYQKFIENQAEYQKRRHLSRHKSLSRNTITLGPHRA